MSSYRVTLNTSRTLIVVRRYGLLVAAGSLAGLLLHVGVVGIEAFVIGEPVFADARTRLWRSAFSFPFLPILLIEVVLTTLTLLLWNRLRHALREAHALDLQREQQDTRIRTLQRTMALMAQYLAQQNNQILSHIAARREKGQQPSPAVDAASRRMSEVLGIMSEVSFAAPYLPGTAGENVDLLVELERRLQARDDEEPGRTTPVS